MKDENEMEQSNLNDLNQGIVQVQSSINSQPEIPSADAFPTPHDRQPDQAIIEREGNFNLLHHPKFSRKVHGIYQPRIRVPSDIQENDPVPLLPYQQLLFWAWVEFLKRCYWKWFCVLTFDGKANEDKARNNFNTFAKYFLIEGANPPMFVAVIHQIKGFSHIHFLSKEFKKDKYFANSYWQKYRGHSLIVPFEHDRRGIKYMANRIARFKEYQDYVIM